MSICRTESRKAEPANHSPPKPRAIPEGGLGNPVEPKVSLREPWVSLGELRSKLLVSIAFSNHGFPAQGPVHNVERMFGRLPPGLGSWFRAVTVRHSWT